MKISRQLDPQHPLLADRRRFDHITDIMYAKIQKTLFPGSRSHWRPSTARSGFDARDGGEQILAGTGVSAVDILSDAVIALLQYPPERLEDSWEGLAVRIARNKAVDASRASEKGLRGTDHRPEFHLVSGDAEKLGIDGETMSAPLEMVAGNLGDPEGEYIAMEGALTVRDLARELLDEREQEVFFAIHFLGYNRREVGDRLSLSGQRIGQIYQTALDTLESHPDYPFKPPIPLGQTSKRRNS